MDKKTLQKKLEQNIANPNFSSFCDEIISEIKTTQSPEEAIETLLNFMSEHPELKYGMPGAFVHFIETFPEPVYVDFLLKSIQNQPTEHNTWMLLRIMNTWSSERQKEYIAAMKKAIAHPKISDDLKKTISEDLLDFQE